jgi:hypothetical protein
MFVYTLTITPAIEENIIEEYINVSKDKDDDEFNERELNISSQKRRQNLIPWKLVLNEKKNHQN